MNIFVPHESKCIILWEFAMHMTPTRTASGVWSSLCYKSIRFGWWCLDVIQMDVKLHCGFWGNLYVGLAKCGLLWSYCYRFGFLDVAKCNLGKVNLEAMLVSCFPSYIRGGPMSLAGAPRDLYTQLLACSSSQSVVSIACCLRASLPC